jgi:hypothetical protein
MSNNVKVSFSFPFLTITFLIFMTLKLCGVITWSWWWVTAPLWIPLGIGLVFLAIAAVMFIIAAFLR